MALPENFDIQKKMDAKCSRATEGSMQNTKHSTHVVAASAHRELFQQQTMEKTSKPKSQETNQWYCSTSTSHSKPQARPTAKKVCRDVDAKRVARATNCNKPHRPPFDPVDHPSPLR
jgi:hypothetical protein